LVRKYVLKFREDVMSPPSLSPGVPPVEEGPRPSLYDTFIDNGNPTVNYYGNVQLKLSQGFGAVFCKRPILKIYNLEGVNADDIVEMFLMLKMFSTSGGLTLQSGRLIESPEKYKYSQATWNERFSSVAWTAAGGLAGTESPFDVKQINSTSIGNYVYFNLTELKDKELIEIFIDSVGNVMGSGIESIFHSTWAASASNRPHLLWTLKVWSIDAFSSEEEKLRIRPWDQNQLYPELYWGKVSPDDTFTSFKVWRKASQFTKPVAEGATEISPVGGIPDITLTEYVDTTIPNIGTFYYMVTAESTDNIGDDATLSNVVSLIVPRPSAVTVPAGAITPGMYKTISLSPNKLTKKYRIDWGDGTISWYELESATSSPISVSHLYISHGVFTVRGMFEDTDGFWSDWINGSNTVTVNDTTPLAKLQVNINKELVGVNVILNATLSQPISSLATITKYEFRRYGGDPYFDNGANPIYKFSSSLIPAGVKTAEVRITTSTGLQAIGTCNYELYTETAEALGLTRYSSISSIKEDAGSFDIDVQIPIGGTGTEYDNVNSKKAMRITVNGITTRRGTTSDIDRLRTIYNSRKLVKITSTTFKRGTTVEWTGKIESEPKFNNMSPNAVSWSFTMKVYSRSPAV
jgi:hypothetical protein